MLLIYTKTGCPHCEAVKEHYNTKGIEFEEVNISIHPDRIPEMKRLTSDNLVPVIVDNGKITVGFNGSG